MPKALLALVTALASLFIVGCSTYAAPSTLPKITLTIFAASSLSEAFKEIRSSFEAQHAGAKVDLNLAGSQELRTQIVQGAQADVFASADTEIMDSLGSLKRASRVFAYNRLVIIVPKGNPARVRELGDLAKPGLKLDIADASVPVGTYTLYFLDRVSSDPAFGSDFKQNVLSHVVSRENNVKQVVGKVALGEADAGIAYVTDAQEAAGKVEQIPIPDQFNIVATYPIAVLSTSVHRNLAQQFVDLVVSPEGQSILAKHGFEPTGSSP